MLCWKMLFKSPARYIGDSCQDTNKRKGGGSCRHVEKCDETKMKYRKVYFQCILETKCFFSLLLALLACFNQQGSGK